MKQPQSYYSQIIQDIYISKKQMFHPALLDLSLPELNDIFVKTLFTLYDKQIQVDVDEYSRLAIFIKNNLPFSKNNLNIA